MSHCKDRERLSLRSEGGVCVGWGGHGKSLSYYHSFSASSTRSCVAVSEVQDIEENIWSPRYNSLHSNINFINIPFFLVKH